jgi:hypothetical protein
MTEQPAVTERPWRKPPRVQRARKRRATRQAKIGFATFSFLFLMGMLIWASFWLMPPKTACLVLIGAGYQDNIALQHNVYGWQGLQGMAQLSKETNASFLWGSEQLRLQQEPKELHSGDPWAENLNFPERTVVIFFAMHGGTDAKGPYLLPQDAAPIATDQNRLRIKDILERLADDKLRDKNKLLVLDATQLTSDWQFGILDNDFARQLRALGPEIEKIPNLVVISASDVNQHSWITRYWKRTVFAHHFTEALKGAATDVNNDGRLNAWELFSYLKPNVERWVRDNRDAVQTPILLPEGSVGERRARRMDLTVVKGYDPTPAPSNSEELPPEVEDAWGRYNRLASLSPTPADTSPQLWRAYQDWLLRYEDLRWCGDISASDRAGNELLKLEQDILRNQRLELSSLQNTLAMPAAAGVTVANTPEQVAEFRRLWNARPEEYSKRWQELLKAQKATSGRAAETLRLEFYQFLMPRAEKGLAEDLERAERLIRVIDDPIEPRPAEIHFLAMLQRDRPRTPPPPPEYLPLLQQALRVRVQAEQAALGAKTGEYSFSEEVFSWSQALVKDADRSRELGQDFLFAVQPGAWQDAAKKLREAEDLYRQASGRAEMVRNALSIRNRVLAGLPPYSRWLARRPTQRTSIQSKEIATSFDKVQTLWTETHYLADLLETRKPEYLETAPLPDAEHPTPRSIKEQAKLVSDAFDAVEKEYHQYCRDLANVDTQRMWRDAEDALIVPGRDFPLRQRLHVGMFRTAKRLLLASQERGQAPASVADGDAPDTKDSHLADAQREGRMALAVLGKRWFNERAAGRRGHHENFEQLHRRLETFTVEPEWWKSLETASEEIGASWQQLPGAINHLVDQLANADLEKAQGFLERADRLARTVSGAGTINLTGDAPRQYRRARMINLLLFQAERTFSDHWFSEDPQAEPYYRVAGLRFCDDASQLDWRGGIRPIVQKEREKLLGPGQLVFNGPRQLQITSEQTFPVSYKLVPEKNADIPGGFPVVWLEVGKGIAETKPGSLQRRRIYVGADQASRVPGASRKRPVTEKPAAPPVAHNTAPPVANAVPTASGSPIEFVLRSPTLIDAESEPPPAPRTEQTGVTMRGLYRGQQITMQTGVNLFLLANNIRAVLPLPARGSVAVRAPAAVQQRFGAGNGAVAIVLDCSGSMRPPEGEKWGPNTKYVEATNALRRVLKKVPKGTQVSLWCFGQAIPERGMTVEEAELTIRPILKPKAWNSEAMLEPVMKQVEYPALQPWNESPIVRTIMMAKKDLATANGFKTIVVITDGMDNRFADDRVLNPQKHDIPTYLRREFKDSGIMLNIVGFKVVDEEEKKAQAQFAVVEELPLPGRFYNVKQTVALDGILEQALRQKLHYWIDSAENVSLTGTDGLDVSQIGENAQWYQKGLPPAIYKVRVHTDRRLQKDITLAGGDLLLVDLVSEAGKLLFERGIYSLADFPLKPAREQQGWRMALLQNQRLANQAVQMLVTLEKSTDRRETILQRLRPRMTWMEIVPHADYLARLERETCLARTPYSQRWRYLAGYPAPAWGIDIPQWPVSTEISGGAKTPVSLQLDRPVVCVWWNPDQELIIANTLNRTIDFAKIDELVNRQLQVAGDNITLESVRVEEHRVETKPGQYDVKPCLVVRIAHAPCRPVWATVQGDGLGIAGEEHRFYDEPARYTGIFWPVDPNRINETLSRIGFVSLPQFKQQAAARKFVIKHQDLPLPATDDTRPPQPVTLP